LPFEIRWLQQATSNRLFSPLAVGSVPTAGSVPATSVRIDAAEDPGIELLATFLPAVPVAGGTSRIGGTQIVTATVPIAFNRDLPFYWMASVLRNGDIVPNQKGHAYTGSSDAFEMRFEDELTVTRQDGAWQLPHYDDRAYTVNVGFGIGRQIAAWGYSVACHPGMPVAIDAGAYRFALSDGHGRIGDPVPPGDPAWTMPIGAAYGLVFDQRGNGVLTTL
jgi:hypothetical protein